MVRCVFVRLCACVVVPADCVVASLLLLLVALCSRGRICAGSWGGGGSRALCPVKQKRASFAAGWTHDHTQANTQVTTGGSTKGHAGEKQTTPAQWDTAVTRSLTVPNSDSSTEQRTSPPSSHVLCSGVLHCVVGQLLLLSLSPSLSLASSVSGHVEWSRSASASASLGSPASARWGSFAQPPAVLHGEKPAAASAASSHPPVRQLLQQQQHQQHHQPGRRRSGARHSSTGTSATNTQVESICWCSRSISSAPSFCRCCCGRFARARARFGSLAFECQFRQCQRRPSLHPPAPKHRPLARPAPNSFPSLDDWCSPCPRHCSFHSEQQQPQHARSIGGGSRAGRHARLLARVQHAAFGR